MSESQEEQIDEMLSYSVTNALSYKEFSYNRNQWDNIPPIIPKFVLFLSKHLEALVNKCNERFTQISTIDLKDKVDNDINTLSSKLDILDQRLNSYINDNKTQVDHILNKLQKIDNDHDDFVVMPHSL